MQIYYRFKSLFSLKFFIFFKELMNKIIPTLLLVAVLMGIASSLTVGSCQKYALDGQSCEQCVDHYHLYQGSCYVNILGCKQYIFGNICHQCENNYIMVNNLCCDHNCLAKLFRRQESSSSVSEAISANFQTLSKVIPYINQKYLKGEKMYNLIEIETRDYQDVRRFVFLYELYSQNRVYRWRAIIDITKKEEKQIIDVDWSQVPAYENYLDFHHEEISVTNIPSDLKVLLESNQNLRILKKAEFKYLTQYEYVTEDPRIANTIQYETAYVWPGKNTKITLELRTQEVVIAPPSFIPKQKFLRTPEEIADALKNNRNLQAVIVYLQEQAQQTVTDLITEIQYSTPSQQLVEYTITVSKPLETIKYYLVQNTQNKKIKHVDQKTTKTAEQLEKPLETPEEKVIEEIIEEAIEVVQKEKQEIEKEDQCDGQVCGETQNWMGPLQNEYLGSEIDRIFRSENPQQISFVIVKVWKRQFETYSEYAFLIQSKEQNKFWYFYVIEYVATQQVVFWGQKQVSQPIMQQNEQGQTIYSHPNPQKIVPEQKVQRSLHEIISSYPQNKDLQTRQAILREFPDNRFRYTVSIRHETSVVQYVVLEESPSKLWVQQVKVIEENLPKLTEQVKEETQLKQKVEVIVEQIKGGQPISPEVDLESSEPSQIVVQVIEEERKEPLSKKEQSEIESVQFLREVNPETENFQILYIWQSQDCDHFIEQTILIRIESSEESYEYHYLLINQDNGEYTYLGKTARSNILKDDKEHYLLPNPQNQQENASPELTSALKVAKNAENIKILHLRSRVFPQATRYTLITLYENSSSQIIGLFKQSGEFQILCEEVVQSKIVNEEKYVSDNNDKKISEIIVKEVVNEIEEIQIVQYVSDEPPKGVAEYVSNTVQDVKEGKPIRTWIHEVSGKIKEIVILYKIKNTYIYVYLMVTDEQEYEYMGKETTLQPFKNDQNEYMIPNPQIKVDVEEPKAQTILEYLNKQYPETIGKPIQNIIVRQFEDAERETVIVEEENEEVEYILKENDNQLEVKDKVIIENTPLTKEQQTIEKIVKEAIETVKEDKKDVAIDQGCDGINCDKRSETEQVEAEKEGTEFDQIFREVNPDIEVFEVVEEWRRDFTTFTEITVLIRSGNLYWYLYLLKDKTTSELQYWGQQILEKPARDQIGKFDLKNKQMNVPETQVQSPLQLILNSNPEISDYQLRKVLLRTFPENRRRSSIELRQPTELVLYVILDNGNSSWIQERTVLQTGLPLLNQEIRNEAELQFKTEVIVDETLSQVPVEVSLPKQNIEVPEKVQPVLEVQDKKVEVIEKVQESPRKGHTEIVYNELTPKQKTIIEKLTVNIPQAYQKLEPILVETQKFCDSQDFILVYAVEKQLIVLAFRASLLKNQKVQFLGERKLPQIETEEFSSIIARVTRPENQTDAQVALSAISEKYPEYSSQQPIETEFMQLGQALRIVAVYKFSANEQKTNPQILHRFLIGQSQNEQLLQIIEECRLNDKKQKYFTEEKFSSESPIQEEIKTNEPEKLIERQPITTEVIENVQEILKKEPQLKPEIEEIVVEEYEKNIEYIVEVEEESEKGEKQKKDIVVVVDKESEKIEFVSVEEQPTEQVQESIEEQIPVDPETHKPVVEEKLQKLIEKIVEEVKEDPKTPINNPEIIEVTKKPVGNIEEIKEIIKDKDTEEVVEVISIVNEQEDTQQIVSIQPVMEGQQTPEPEPITENYETIIEEDPSVQEVVQKLIEKPEEKPVSVTKKQFDIGTEYIVELEQQKDGEKITKEAVVVQDKETKQLIVVEKPTEKAPEKEQQEKVKEIPISESKDKPDSGSPVLDELLENIIEESVPKNEDNQTPSLEIIEIVEEKQTEHVEKIVEHVKDTQTGKQYEVTAIVDEKEKKEVVLDIKEVQPETPVPEKLVELKPEIIVEVIEESVKEIKEKQQPEAPCCTEAPQEIEKVVIKPAEIEQKIKETLSKENETKQTKQPEISLTVDEALELVHTEYPETVHTTLLTQEQKTLPNSVLYTLVLSSPTKKYTVLVKKTPQSTEVVIEDVNEIPQIQIEEQKQITELVEEIQEQDTKDYQLIDPDSIWQSKALQILTTKKLKEFQRVIDISEIETDDLISQAVIYLRANWAIIKEGVVIRVLQDINTPMTKQYSIYFFVNEQTPQKSTKYKVYEFVIEIKLENNEYTYDVLSIREVLENGRETNVVLQQKNIEEDQETINIAYGYESVPLTALKNNSTLEAIVAQVETRYSDLIKTQSIVSIEVLELKTGKLNIIIRYPHIYFTVFWDPLLERVLLLNSVSSFSSEKYKPVQDMDTNAYYGQSVQYCIGVHQKEIGLTDYKIVHSGELDTDTEFIFYNEISSGSKKFRCVVGVSKQLHETREISWDEIVQISLEHYKFDEMTKLFIANYQKLTDGELQNNKDFKYVYNYALKQNKILESAHLIGAAYKPQNLGFAFKIFFMLTDSQIVAVQIYIESFNQKLQQISLSYLDLQNGFASIATEGTEVQKIVEAIAKKAKITLLDGEYLIHSVEGKDFLFGNLFRVLIQINGIEHSGILYHDHTTEETNLIQWKVLAEGQGCKQYQNDGIHCVVGGCEKGFYWEESERRCYRQTAGCQKYKEGDREVCESCTSGLQRINNVCTEDCGPACVFIKTF